MNVDPRIMNAIDKQIASGRIESKDLLVGDKVTVHTKHSIYYIYITEKGIKVNSTNDRYCGPYEGTLIGTTIAPGSSILCPQAFAVGGSLELWVEKIDTKPGKIITSEVKAVSINGVQVLPISEVMS